MSYSCTVVKDDARGGMDKVVLAKGDGSESRVEIYLFGATVTSWVSSSVERLFVGEKAVWNGEKAIRGGIPVVFPQFGQPDTTLAQHGFARTSFWDWSCSCGESDSGKVVFTLTDSVATQRVWPHAFKLFFTVELTSTSLRCHLLVRNPEGNAGSFPCQALLHTYVRLPHDISDLRVQGFQGHRYVDKMAAGEVRDEISELVTVDCETDRIYLSSSTAEIPDLTLLSKGSPFMTVAKKAAISELEDGKSCQPLAADVVLWNAWVDKSAALPDLGSGAYKSYVCVEPGVVSDRVEVPSGAALSLETTLTVLS